MSYANPGRRVIGDQDVRAYLRRRGDDANVQGFLAKNLAKGNALSAQVANKASDGKYSKGDSFLLQRIGSLGSFDDDVDQRYGRGSAANLAAIFGGDELDLAPGTVFTGATRVTTPRSSSRTVNGGEASTPESTRYDLTVLPRSLFSQGGGNATGAPAADQSRQQTDDRALQAAREAVSRAGQYKDSTAGGASSGSAAGGTGSSGNLFENIAALGQGQINDYDRRFIPKMQADAALGTQEIGYGIRGLIDSLPGDLALPDYLDPFARGSYRKGNKKSLYDTLRSQIA